MPKNKKRTTSDAPKATKKAQMFRFTAETAEMLEVASDRAGMSKTVYVMLALRHQFQADGLLPPDPIFASVAPLPRDDRKARPRRGNSSQGNKGQG
jgi:hypothetical protein